LVARPSRPVEAQALSALADADARANYEMFLAFRGELLAAGTLEAWYLALMRRGEVAVPPLFIDLVVEAIVDSLLDHRVDAFGLRAGELLHRAQRVAIDAGRVVVGDLGTLDRLNDDGGFGDLGRLLKEAQAPLRGSRLQVLDADNAGRYGPGAAARSFLLDMTHEVANDLGHGLSFTLTRAHSGLRALAQVLERWVVHFLGVRTTIVPLPRIDDSAWSWHIGLDAEATAILNELWTGDAIEPARGERLIGLFRLAFADPAEMRADLAGKPVYLGLAMTDQRTLKLKPQNLLLDLPLAAWM
ncbi:MAG: DUF6352 family protein, partial [Caldimonas sp.]